MKGKLLKRKRRYLCKLCGKILIRISDKQWIESFCEENGKTRIMLIK